MPLPPPTLTRRYRFLDEKILIRPRHPERLHQGQPCARIRSDGSPEVGLGSALGTKANDNRRREALTWAFSVWRTAGAGIQKALWSARLYGYRQSSGWRLATQAAFSSSWTSIGLTLENFLVEASDTSPDCRRARNALLVDFADWPSGHGGTKRHWVSFLMLLGVDGRTEARGGTSCRKAVKDGPGTVWCATVTAKAALDQDWCTEASPVCLPKSVHDVQQKRLSRGDCRGRSSTRNCPKPRRRRSTELAFRHLEVHNAKYLTFTVGRYRPRSQRILEPANAPHAARDVPAIQEPGSPLARTRETRLPEGERVLGDPHEAGAELPRFLECMPDTVSEARRRAPRNLQI